VTGRRGRRRRKLLDNFNGRRGYSNLKEEALDRTVWRVGFGRGFGPVVRQTAKWMMKMREIRLLLEVLSGCEVSGFCGGVVEAFTLLGYSAT
jgi:hypothetical protein